MDLFFYKVELFIKVEKRKYNHVKSYTIIKEPKRLELHYLYLVE